MKAAWDWIFSYSIQGTGLILLALLARICLQKSPAVFRYVLWMLVFVGLICPWRMELPVAPKEVVSLVLPLDQETEQGEAAPWAQTSEPVLPVAPEERAVTSRVAEAKKNDLLPLIWAAGACGGLGYGLWGSWKWRRKLQGAKEVEHRVWEVEGLPTAFVFGLRSRIYLPAHLPKEERAYILLHEQIHLRRKDHWVKALCYGILCLYWFHPLVWVAFSGLETDMERACDEAVLRQMGDGVKKSYSASLLRLAAKESGLLLGFGERAVKKRLLAILRYRKPALGMVAFSAVWVIVAGCAMFSRGPRNIEEELETWGEEQGDIFAETYQVDVEEVQTETVQVASFPDLYTGVEVWQATPVLTTDTEEVLLTTDNWLQEGHTVYGQRTYLVYETSSKTCLGELWAVPLTGMLSDLETNVRALLEQEGMLEQETYPGAHAMATFTMTDGQKAQMLLSQPVRQGAGGIWCVERWMDSTGNLYYEGPQVNETALSYYTSLQEVCDEGHRVGLLSPEDVARTFLADWWGDHVTLDHLETDVTLEQFFTPPVSTYFVKVVDMAEDGTLQVQQGTPHWEGEALSRTQAAAEQNLTVDWWDGWGSKKTPSQTITVLLLSEDGTTVERAEETAWKQAMLEAVAAQKTPCFWLWEQGGQVIRLEEQFVP